MEEYNFVLDSASGPYVHYRGGGSDEFYEDIEESAADFGYAVDWTNQVRTSPDGADEQWYATPLVLIDDGDSE